MRYSDKKNSRFSNANNQKLIDRYQQRAERSKQNILTFANYNHYRDKVNRSGRVTANNSIDRYIQARAPAPRPDNVYLHRTSALSPELVEFRQNNSVAISHLVSTFQRFQNSVICLSAGYLHLGTRAAALSNLTRELSRNHSGVQYSARKSAALNCLRMMQCAGSALPDPTFFSPAFLYYAIATFS
ncbi:hypothetical protein EVAR_42715_1 [Eumeta japonica]|uniref:Uncharacterized protein n=1 Tax=Eumeta variegata TaxID=151549 RepID=A0A4C1WYS8_EUMVA|nr:hypothetical protein EVAR_42715_1 [Eumeta japonica]